MVHLCAQYFLYKHEYEHDEDCSPSFGSHSTAERRKRGGGIEGEEEPSCSEGDGFGLSIRVPKQGNMIRSVSIFGYFHS